MKILANSRMLNLLANRTIEELIICTKLNARLNRLLKSPIIEIDDCFFLKTLYHKVSNKNMNLYHDRTGFECFVNHFHIEDYITTIENDMFAQIFKVVSILGEKLQKFNNVNNFYIIVSINKGSYTLRFHKVRDQEFWIDDNLEEFETEAIAKIYI